MDTTEISLHEVRFYQAVKRYGRQWVTARQLSARAHVAERTARAYARKFVHAHILEVAVVFPAYRYRMASTISPRSAPYLQRLTQAEEAVSGQLAKAT